MSNPDSFIAEVTEEVRRDRLFALFRRYGWIAVLLVLAIVGGAAWNEWSKARARASAEAFGDALLAALEQEDRSARRAALEAIGATGARGAVVALLAAAEALEAGDRAAAMAALSGIAADPALPASYRQLAAVKLVMLAGREMPVAEREALLAEALAPGAAFRPLALEQQALLRLEAGDREGAVELLRGLLQEPQVPAGLRRRAGQLLTALGAAPQGAG